MYLKTDTEREIWTHAYKAALSGAFTRGDGPCQGAQRAAESAHAVVREYRAFAVDGRQPKTESAASHVDAPDGSPDAEGVKVSADRDEHATPTP